MEENQPASPQPPACQPPDMCEADPDHSNKPSLHLIADAQETPAKISRKIADHTADLRIVS